MQPDVNPQWSDNLELFDTLANVKKETVPLITLGVLNPTDHDIVLSGRTVVGKVQTIAVVLPARVFEEVIPQKCFNFWITD